MSNPFFIFFFVAVFCFLVGLYQLKNKNILRERLDKIQDKPKYAKADIWEKILGVEVQGNLKENDVFVATVTISIASVILSFLFVSNVFLATAVGLITFFIFPRIYIKHRAQKIKNEFNRNIAKGVGSLTAALRGGSTLYHGFKDAAREMPPPVDTIFIQIAEDIENGAPMEEAMQNMAKKIDTPEAHLLSDSVALIKEIGGGTSAINLLESVGNAAREQEYIRGKMKSTTSHLIIAFAACSIIPFGLAGFLSFTMPEYAMVFKTMQGKVMILIAILLIAVGWYIVRSILKTTAESI